MKQLRILHLDDDPLDRELIAARLFSEVPVAEVVGVDGPDAYLAALRGPPFDAILADFSLPGYDGMRALAAARELSPRTPFLLVSGAIGEDRALEAVRQGAIDYILKDRLERLGPAVARALREVEHREERERAERERDRLLEVERQARQAAEAANRMKDDFLAIVSHELRTPLSSILGWIDILKEETSDAAEWRHGLAVIERNARAQARLIEDMLDVSRIVSGKLRLDLASVHVAHFVEAAAEMVRPVAAAKEVALTVHVDPDVGETVGDATRLQQVVWNLASNAVKFTPKGGHVDVRARRHEGWIELVVVDDGIGIPADALPCIFDRFFQVDGRAATRRHGGLGLGLAIVRSLVELHGGKLRAESDGPGKGATFTVRLPVSVLRADTEEGAAGVPASGDAIAGLRVLLVDDEPDSLELLRILLERSGAVVETADSAESGLRAVVRFSPQVIVCDIGMPVVDGHSMIRAVRALPDATPAIALTAFARREDRDKALAAGFQRHLAKPVGQSTLIAAIAGLVRRTG